MGVDVVEVIDFIDVLNVLDVIDAHNGWSFLVFVFSYIRYLRYLVAYQKFIIFQAHEATEMGETNIILTVICSWTGSMNVCKLFLSRSAPVVKTSSTARPSDRGKSELVYLTTHGNCKVFPAKMMFAQIFGSLHNNNKLNLLTLA